MMRQRLAALRMALAAGDFLVVVAAFVAASLLRFGSGWTTVWETLIPAIGLVVPLFALGVVGVFARAGLYRLRARWSVRTELRDMARSGAVLVAVTLALLYLFKLEDVSRGFLAYFFPLVALGTAGARLAVRLAFRRIRGTGYGVRRLLVVGSGQRAREFVEWAAERPDLGICLAGFVDDDGGALPGCERVGDLWDFPRVLSEQVVDEVAICLPFTDWATIDLIAQVAEEQGKVVRIPVDLMGRAIAKGRLEQLEGLPILSLVNGPDQAVALAAKRVFDVVGAAALLVLTAPVLLASALAILVRDGRPVLFRQQRGGLHGRPFGALKFRTMVRDADRRRVDLLDRNERVGPAFKVADDPRVTRFGRFLRKTSVDELPQLLNVLKGDMSLVGPRPPMLDEVGAYDLWYRRRLSVKPGITGLWQVTARSDPSFERWVELDLHYIDTWSLWGDLKLLCRTPAALVRTPGD